MGFQLASVVYPIFSAEIAIRTAAPRRPPTIWDLEGLFEMRMTFCTVSNFVALGEAVGLCEHRRRCRGKDADSYMIATPWVKFWERKLVAGKIEVDHCCSAALLLVTTSTLGHFWQVVAVVALDKFMAGGREPWP